MRISNKTYWSCVEGVWQQLPAEPTGKCIYYLRFQVGQGSESVWLYFEGVRRRRVEIAELPPELLLTLTLLEIVP